MANAAAEKVDSLLEELKALESTEDRKAFLDDLKSKDVVFYNFLLHQINKLGLSDWILAV